MVSVARTFWYQHWTPNTTTTDGYYRQYSFQLGNLPSFTDFSNIFDQFRLNAVKVVFRPRYDGFMGNDTTDTTLPGVSNQAGTKMHILVDPDSNMSPSGTYSFANLNSLLENGRIRSYSGNRDITVFFKPKTNRTVGGVAAGNRMRAPWLQTANSTAVDHFGFYAFAQDTNFTGTFGQAWDVFVTYYMQFKNLKS